MFLEISTRLRQGRTCDLLRVITVVSVVAGYQVPQPHMAVFSGKKEMVDVIR